MGDTMGISDNKDKAAYATIAKATGLSEKDISDAYKDSPCGGYFTGIWRACAENILSWKKAAIGCSAVGLCGVFTSAALPLTDKGQMAGMAVSVGVAGFFSAVSTLEAAYGKRCLRKIMEKNIENHKKTLLNGGQQKPAGIKRDL